MLSHVPEHSDIFYIVYQILSNSTLFGLVSDGDEGIFMRIAPKVLNSLSFIVKDWDPK
jgi:hypothetical protein